MTLPEIAIKRHVTMLMIIVSLVVLGAVAVFRLPLAFMPDFDQPMLFVRFDYPNASPSQIERLVIRPMEEALGSVNGLKNMWSHVDNNGGNVGLEFDWSQNMKVARTDVWEKIDRIRKDLPADIGDVTGSSLTGPRLPPWSGPTRPREPPSRRSRERARGTSPVEETTRQRGRTSVDPSPARGPPRTAWR